MGDINSVNNIEIVHKDDISIDVNPSIESIEEVQKGYSSSALSIVYKKEGLFREVLSIITGKSIFDPAKNIEALELARDEFKKVA